MNGHTIFLFLYQFEIVYWQLNVSDKLNCDSSRFWASLVAQMVKNPPAMWVRSLGSEDSLQEGMATHCSILAWRIPCTEEPDSYGPYSQRVGPDWSYLAHMHTRHCGCSWDRLGYMNHNHYSRTSSQRHSKIYAPWNVQKGPQDLILKYTGNERKDYINVRKTNLCPMRSCNHSTSVTL